MTMLVGSLLVLRGATAYYCQTMLIGAVTLLAVFASDAIALPLAPSLPTGEVQYILDNSAAKMLLATEKCAEKANQVLQAGLAREPLFDIRQKLKKGAAGSESVQLEDPKQPPSGGMMLYTSGTTSRPVCRSQIGEKELR